MTESWQSGLDGNAGMQNCSRD